MMENHKTGIWIYLHLVFSDKIKGSPQALHNFEKEIG